MRIASLIDSRGRIEYFIVECQAQYGLTKYLNEIRILRNEVAETKNDITPKKLTQIDMRLRDIIHRMTHSKDLNELSELLYSRTQRNVFERIG